MVTGQNILEDFETVKDDFGFEDVARIVDELFYCVIGKGFRPTEQQVISVQAFFLDDRVAPNFIYNFIKALTPIVQGDKDNYAALLILRNPFLVEKVASRIKGDYR